MVRIRQGWLAAGVAVMLGLGLSACKKDDKATTGTAEKPGDTSGGGGAKAPGDDLTYLPVESEVVIGINLSQVQQSSLWKQFIEPKLMTGETQRKLSELKAKCGYDPVTSIRSVSMGMKSLEGDKPDVVAVVHGLDKGKTLDCLDKYKDEMAKDGTEVTRDGDLLLIKDKQGNQSAFSFLNGTTGIFVAGSNANAAGVKAVAAGTSTLKSSPNFLEKYKKVNTGDSLWLLVNGKVMDKASLPVKARSVYGSLNVTDGLALDLRVQFEKPDEATQAASMLNGQAAQAKAFVDKAEFTSDGSELHAVVAMSNQKLQALVSQLGGLIGAFGGMGGLGGGTGNP